MAGTDDIDGAVAIAEAETGIRGGSLRVCSAVAPTSRSRPWSVKEDAFIRENLGKITEAEIAAALGRTWNAVHIRWERELRLPAPSKSPEILTAEHVAMGLGLDGKSVHRLIDTGLLPGRRLPHADVTRVVDRRAFMLWLVDPSNWVYFKADRVGAMRPRGKRAFTGVYDFAFWEDARELVAAARARWKDEWLTPGQTARILGINPALKAHPINRAIRTGRLKAKRWGNWKILRSDLPGPGLTFDCTGKVVTRPELRREERERVVVELRGRGLTWEHVGADPRLNLCAESCRLAFLRNSARQSTLEAAR